MNPTPGRTQLRLDVCQRATGTRPSLPAGGKRAEECLSIRGNLPRGDTLSDPPHLRIRIIRLPCVGDPRCCTHSFRTLPATQIISRFGNRLR